MLLHQLTRLLLLAWFVPEGRRDDSTAFQRRVAWELTIKSRRDARTLRTSRLPSWFRAHSPISVVPSGLELSCVRSSPALSCRASLVRSLRDLRQCFTRAART